MSVESGDASTTGTDCVDSGRSRESKADTAVLVAEQFKEAMSKIVEPEDVQNLVAGLSTVAASMEPKKGVAYLTHAMTKTTDSTALEWLAEKLSAIAARLEPKEGSQVCAATATYLAQIMSITRTDYDLASLAKGLSAVVSHAWNRKKPYKTSPRP